MNIYDMLISRALNGNSGGSSGDSDADTATVTLAVQGSDWIGAIFYLSYALEYIGATVTFDAEAPFVILSTDPTVKLPLLKDSINHWIIRAVGFYAPDGETQLQGNLLFTGGIRNDEEITGDCTITLIVGGQQ